MKFAIITHVEHIKQNNCYFAYSPYVREMNIWGNYADQLHIVAPLGEKQISNIYESYKHPKIIFEEVEAFSLISEKGVFKTLLVIPKITRQIVKAMRDADHIHLRCPGNMGLLGCLVQILFPGKQKTAKYAGNWDSKSRQPWSYRLQKWILKNTFLTRNMQVLVYGEWEGSTTNIKPFFTATYHESDKKSVQPRSVLGPIRFLFVGTLSKGKQPLYAVQLVEQLSQAGYDVYLDMYGEGMERKALETYIQEKELQAMVTLRGNQTAATVQTAYENSHFLILPSQSEGWPKVVAEAMFWGCIPVATPVSCVPNMLDNGERGIVLTLDFEKDIKQMRNTIDHNAIYQAKAAKAEAWSRQYTLDYFEQEIKLLLRR